MPRKHEPELMRVSEAAELLGVSGKTMTRMLKDGELTVVGLDPVDHRAKLVRRADRSGRQQSDIPRLLPHSLRYRRRFRPPLRRERAHEWESHGAPNAKLRGTDRQRVL